MTHPRISKKSPELESTLKNLSKTGVNDILDLLCAIYAHWSEKKSGSEKTTLDHIRNQMHEFSVVETKETSKEEPAIYTNIRKRLCSKKPMAEGTLSTALQVLTDLELAKKQGRIYSVTDLGLWVHPWIKAIEAIPTGRDSFTFDVQKDPNSWFSKVISIIAEASSDLMMTTRTFRTYSDEKRHQTLLASLIDAANEGAKIRIIADPSLPRSLENEFRSRFNAETRFMSSAALEKPPNFLKPIFLQDFSHVMIADYKHWLCLFPHRDESKHSGKGATNDPLAQYLGDIFDTFWKFAGRRE